MTEQDRNGVEPEMIDVRGAAALVGRHPETVRRWVWAGRLAARRQGNRLVVARADVEALAKTVGGATMTLGAWADLARATWEDSARTGRQGSAADLVIEDRAQRSQSARARR